MRHYPTLSFAFCVAAQSLALTSASSSAWSLLSSQSQLGNHVTHVQDDPPFHHSFDSFVDHLMQDWHIPGLAIAVVHENQTWSKGYGYATLPDVPFTPYTLFQTASTTKSFTASLAALLVENQRDFGHVTWDTPLHDIVGNDFVLKDDYLTTHISFLDAMSHRTGMPRHDALWYDQGLDVKSQTCLMRHLDTSAGFRMVFQYCNLMFTAVSHVLQSVTGKPQAELLREWIFEPLGMNYSYYSLEDAATCQNADTRCTLANSYAWNKRTESYKKWSLDLLNPPNGAGGVISNVVDYSKWIRALMYESGPVSKEGHTMMKYPLSFLGPESPYAGPGWYGLGIEGGIYRNEKVFSHNGGISAYASTFKFLPDRKFGVVVFQNSQNNAMEAMAWRLIDEFLGVPEDEFYDMNKTQYDFMKKRQEQLELLPSKLYPNVPSIPVKPQLPLQNYTGVYMNAAYGNFSISLEAPADMLDMSEFEDESGSAGLTLYATSRGGTVLFTFRHVSLEHWLLELRMVIYGSKAADDYKQAKFESAANGVVQRLGVIMEAAMSDSGDKAWAWFERVE